MPPFSGGGRKNRGLMTGVWRCLRVFLRFANAESTVVFRGGLPCSIRVHAQRMDWMARHQTSRNRPPGQ